MNIMTRIRLSILRQKGKSLILFLAIAVIGTSFVSSVLIKGVMSKTNDQLYKEANPFVAFVSQGEKQMSVETAEDVARSQYVEFLEYKRYIDSEITGLKKYKGDLPKETSGTKPDVMTEESVPEGILSFEGTNVKELLAIKTGRAKLLSGRTFTDEEMKSGKKVAIITKEIAELNQLQVGQTLPGKYVERDFSIIGSQPNKQKDFPTLFAFDTPFEIIGIIDVEAKNESSIANIPNISEEQKKSYQEFSRVAQKNTAYTPNTAISIISKEAEKQREISPNKAANPNIAGQMNGVFITPVYKLKDAQNISAFIEENKSKMPEGTLSISDQKKISDIIAKSKTFSVIADILFIVSIAMTVLVLALLLTLFMRDRKSEIGLLSALGERREKIILQMFIETMVIAFLGISLALGLGSAVSQHLSKEIVKTQSVSENKAEQQTMTEPTLEMIAPFVDLKPIDGNFVVNNSQAGISAGDIALVYGISLVSVTGASAAPLIYILRLKPKKILL